jgi:hypothetical protein
MSEFKVLQVFDSFYSAWKPYPDVKIDAIYFEYDGKLWRATIKTRYSVYYGKAVLETKINIPNQDLVFTEGVQREILNDIICKICKMFPDFDISEVGTQTLGEHECKISILNETVRNCIAVNFVYKRPT